MSRIVSFRQMQHGTREDYLLLDESERAYAAGLAERVLDALRHLDHSLEGYPVSRLQHSLQAATRALRDGADEELIVGALLHDVGDELAPYNHAELAAAILRPYVRPEVSLDRRAARPVPELLLRAPLRRGSPRARAPARSPLVRGHACTSAPPGTSARSIRTTAASPSRSSSRWCGGIFARAPHDPRYQGVPPA